jgi:folylpolyglutamate synthase/dihydropteroate synthase
LGPDEACAMTLVFACLRDKPLAELAQILFPLFEQVVFPPIHSPRATPVEELLEAARATGTPAIVATSVAEALALAESPPQSVAARADQNFTAAGVVGQDFSPDTKAAEPKVGQDFSPGTTATASQGPLGPEVCLSRFSSLDSPQIVVISGSVYLVGEARSLLMSNIGHKQETPA